MVKFAIGFFTFHFSLFPFQLFRIPLYSSNTRLHQYSLWRFGEESERHALEHLLVLRFGEQLHALVSVSVGMCNEMRHNLVGYSLALMSVSHSHAFYYAFFQSTTCHYLVGRLIDEGGIVVYIVETQTVVAQKLFYAATLAGYVRVELYQFQCEYGLLVLMTFVSCLIA